MIESTGGLLAVAGFVLVGVSLFLWRLALQRRDRETEIAIYGEPSLRRPWYAVIWPFSGALGSYLLFATAATWVPGLAGALRRLMEALGFGPTISGGVEAFLTEWGGLLLVTAWIGFWALEAHRRTAERRAIVYGSTTRPSQ